MAQQSAVESKLLDRVAAHEKDMVELLSGLVRVPAIGPKNGGEGEAKKAEWLKGYCERHGFVVEEYGAPDKSVPGGKRPSLVVRVKGRSSARTLWVMSHIDVVPPGSTSDWKTPPFEPALKGGKLYGRGSEDNGQSLAASFWALKSVLEDGRKPTFDTALLFVADEETGSKLGLTWLLDHYPKMFAKDDLILVPDGGDEKGEKIEVAEKTILWLQFTVRGKQCHGSMPYLGNNAARAAAKLTVALDEALHEAFDEKDDLFMPPESTFEPTRHDANVPNVNTIPGQEVLFFDTRILPRYKSDDVLRTVHKTVKEVEKLTGTKIQVDIQQHDPAAPPTPADAEIVRRLMRALRETRPKVEPTVWGVGGGTVAAIFRRRGYDAAVWSTYDELAHSPNEYAVVKNLVEDAKVYASLFTQPERLPPT